MFSLRVPIRPAAAFLWAAMAASTGDDDSFVLGRLHDGLFLNRTMDFWGKQQAAIQALDAARLNETIKKYYKATSVYRVTGGDKKKSGAKG